MTALQSLYKHAEALAEALGIDYDSTPTDEIFSTAVARIEEAKGFLEAELDELIEEDLARTFEALEPNRIVGDVFVQEHLNIRKKIAEYNTWIADKNLEERCRGAAKRIGFIEVERVGIRAAAFVPGDYKEDALTIDIYFPQWQKLTRHVMRKDINVVNK